MQLGMVGVRRTGASMVRRLRSSDQGCVVQDRVPHRLAFADHGKVGATLPADGGYAEVVRDEFKREGVDDEALAARLQREGVQAFAKSWSALMARIREKSERGGTLQAARPASAGTA